MASTEAVVVECFRLAIVIWSFEEAEKRGQLLDELKDRRSSSAVLVHEHALHVIETDCTLNSVQRRYRVPQEVPVLGTWNPLGGKCWVDNLESR